MFLAQTVCRCLVEKRQKKKKAESEPVGKAVPKHAMNTHREGRYSSTHN